MGKQARIKRLRAERRVNGKQLQQHTGDNRQQRRKQLAQERQSERLARKEQKRAGVKSASRRNLPNMQRIVPFNQFAELSKNKDMLQKEVAQLRTEVIVLRDKVKKYEGKLPFIAVPT